MKILAFVDTHGNKKAIEIIIKKAKKENPDILICAGDITNWGENIKSLIKDLEKLNILLLIIPGNHETSELIDSISSKLIINLHKKSYELNDYIFLGYGEGGFSKEDKEFEKITNKFKKTIKKDSKIILVTHAPPYGRLDFIFGHQGNEAIRKFIEEIQPIIHICGHLHEYEGKEDKIKRTRIINPGPYGILIET